MVKAVDGWEFNNLAGLRYSYWTTVRRVVVQGLVCSPRMVVIQIRRHKSLEMPLVEHDDVVEKFSALRPDHSRNALAVYTIAVSNQITWSM